MVRESAARAWVHEKTLSLMIVQDANTTTKPATRHENCALSLMSQRRVRNNSRAGSKPGAISSARCAARRASSKRSNRDRIVARA